MDFRFTKAKTIVSVVVLGVWYFMISFFGGILCSCVPNGSLFAGCIDYYKYIPMKGVICHCACIPLSTVIFQYILIFLPPVLVYVIWSYRQGKKKGKKKK